MTSISDWVRKWEQKSQKSKPKSDYSGLPQTDTRTAKFVGDVGTKLVNAGMDFTDVKYSIHIESMHQFDRQEIQICFMYYGAGNRACVNLPENCSTRDKKWNETVDEMVAWLFMMREISRANARGNSQGESETSPQGL